MIAFVAALLALDQSAPGPPPPSAPTAAAPPAAPAEPAEQTHTVTVTAHRIQHIEPVVVTAPQACPEPDPAHYPAAADPKVVDSYPRPGGSPRPGLVEVRVTFDAPMSCYAEVTTKGGEDDPCQAQGTWVLPDRKSFLMPCRLQPGVTYTLTFQKVDGRGFVGRSGRQAEPFALQFTAQAGPPVTVWPDAQREDPGPPGARATNAYVTCTDATLSAPESDCRRQRFGQPASPP